MTLRDNAVDDDVDLTLLAKKLEGYSGSDCKEICREAIVRISHEHARADWTRCRRPTSSMALVWRRSTRHPCGPRAWPTSRRPSSGSRRASPSRGPRWGKFRSERAVRRGQGEKERAQLALCCAWEFYAPVFAVPHPYH